VSKPECISKVDDGCANIENWTRAERDKDVFLREGEFYAGYLEEVSLRPELVSVL